MEKPAITFDMWLLDSYVSQYTVLVYVNESNIENSHKQYIESTYTNLKEMN